MNPWIPIVVLSAMTGAVSALAGKGRTSMIVAAGVPWFGVLVYLLYSEYFALHQRGGASMWPIAQLFAGTAAALIGLGSAAAVRFVRRKS